MSWNNEELGIKLCQLECVVNFLCEHDKLDVVIYPALAGGVWIKWLYKNTVKIINQPNNFINSKVLKSTKDTIILLCDDKFYAIDKGNMALAEIPKHAFVLEHELALAKEQESGNKEEVQNPK